MSSPSGPSSSNRQPTWRVHTAPDCTLPSSLSEVHCMLTVSKSRPPTPHVKRSRLIKGPSPMMSTSTEASKPMIPPSQSTNFPILPRLARSGSSKLTAIARRPTAVDLKSFSKSSDALQFDKLESLHQSNSWNQPNISPGSREYDLTSTDPDEDNWRRCGSPERRLSLNCIKSSDPNSTDQDAQKKSTFLHFFRRSVSSSVGPQAKVVDELPKTTETATKSNKKSTSQSAAPMQPRSPRYGSDRDRHSLPEIERIIRMSQKRRDSVSNSNSSSTGGNSSSATGRNVPGRFRSMKIDK